MQYFHFSRQCTFYFLAALVALVVGICVAEPVFAAKQDAPIRQRYLDILDRVPTAAELAGATVTKRGIAELTKKLNESTERDRTIGAVYRHVLNRRPRPLELASWKTQATTINLIRQSLLVSDERRSAVADIYLGLLGRYPRDDEYQFFNERRVGLDAIRAWLSKTEGRRVTVIKRFEQVLGRPPEEAELAYFIASGQDLDFVGWNNRPIANAGADMEVNNDQDIVELDGTASTDLEHDTLLYTWSIVETPPDTTVTLSDVRTARPTFRVPSSAGDPLYQTSGVYRLSLVVSDGQSTSNADEVVVRVLPETTFEIQILQLVNTLRTVEGESDAAPVIMSGSLTNAARKYSRYLFVNGWFESVDRDGKTPADRARNEGYSAKRVGENIALIKSKTPMRITKKRVDDMYKGWYASPEHKRNLLNTDFAEVGIGFFGGEYGPGDYRLYAVEVFAVPQPKKDEVKKDTSAPPQSSPAGSSTTAPST